MKIIPENKITAITSMTNENSTFPKENILEKHPTLVAKATAAETIITASGKFRVLTLFNINAISGHIKITNNATSEDLMDKDIQFIQAQSYARYYLNQTRQITSYFLDLEAYYNDLTVTLTLTGTSGNFPSLGLMYAGLITGCGISEYSAADNLQDFSRFITTENGSIFASPDIVLKNKSIPVFMNDGEWDNLRQILTLRPADFMVFITADTDQFQDSQILYGVVENKSRTEWTDYGVWNTTLNIREVI